MITPLKKYQADLQQASFVNDPEQLQAVEKLEYLYHQLTSEVSNRHSSIVQIKQFFGGAIPPVKGLYFWGGVGRGKTYLVDTFFDCLPFSEKKRLHFHRFMHYVHEQLKDLSGQKDPLKKIARDMSRDCIVICFDEFFVSDITDAMILGELFKHLFHFGVTLVATSNIPPQNLYRNGLQRDRFLPAIALIEKYTEIVNVDGGTDYRLRTLQQAEIYHYPLDQASNDNLNFSFSHLATEEQKENTPLCIEHRLINTVRLAEGVVWFEFDAICRTARSHSDYIELSKIFHTVIIDQLVQMTDSENDGMRRFISLVDEFYERNVKLIIAAEVAMDSIYVGSGLSFEFKRTLSRLQEMQSHEYLGKPHLP